ncbi:cell division protein SepF [Mycetocola miduiensis]|uniref:Cell division protein SepF n=1 Tax=Mycetocola miduiensis TaxID=995034 RepID=A0A1I5A8A5_9MICO|nr:cell division protein SepF [Mycetocola miduiensis]SFN58705.1 cell division inhibitor SepF [Mycetocola miduiensis]
MSNPLKKTMVYLGLADDDLEYEENQASAPATTPPAAVAHNPSTSNTQPPAAVQNRAPVTPLRRPTATKQAAPVELNEILTVHPKQYRDAQVIAETFRDGVPVIINLSQMSEGDAKRLIDFASGLSQGLYGKIERVTSKVFLLSPAHVAVLGDAGGAAADAESTFFAQQ